MESPYQIPCPWRRACTYPAGKETPLSPRPCHIHTGPGGVGNGTGEVIAALFTTQVPDPRHVDPLAPDPALVSDHKTMG